MEQKNENDLNIKEIYIFDEEFNKIIKESLNELIKIKIYGIIIIISLIILSIATSYHACFLKIEEKDFPHPLVPQSNNNIYQNDLENLNNENESNFQNLNVPNNRNINPTIY